MEHALYLVSYCAQHHILVAGLHGSFRENKHINDEFELVLDLVLVFLQDVRDLLEFQEYGIAKFLVCSIIDNLSAELLHTADKCFELRL